MTTRKNLFASFILALSLAIALPPTASANEAGTESGDDVAVVFDLVVLRPIGFVGLVGGTLVFIGSLPFTLSTWTVPKAFNALVRGPAVYTFARELGE
jgi:hypothetical protein